MSITTKAGSSLAAESEQGRFQCVFMQKEKEADVHLLCIPLNLLRVGNSNRMWWQGLRTRAGITSVP